MSSDDPDTECGDGIRYPAEDVVLVYGLGRSFTGVIVQRNLVVGEICQLVLRVIRPDKVFQRCNGAVYDALAIVL